jgi:DNA-binding transcriptional MerR regulator
MEQLHDTSDRLWQVGELAKRTGLSVRALHHYDEIGLLVPSERSFSGYRLYSDLDLRRLYRIVAMRQLGMRLDQISAVIDGTGPDVRSTVRGQLEALDRQRELQDRLRARLQSVLEALDREAEPSTELFVEAIEVTTMIEKYYDSEQLDKLAERGRELGPEAIKEAEREWGELIAAVQEERAQGTDPSSPRMLELARRWQRLIGQFTDGDPGIEKALGEMYKHEGAQAASRGAVDDELVQYVRRAIQALPTAPRGH